MILYIFPFASILVSKLVYEKTDEKEEKKKQFREKVVGFFREL